MCIRDRANVGKFRELIVNGAKNAVRNAPKTLVSLIKKPVGALVGLGLSLPLIGPAMRSTGKFLQKVPLIGGLFKGSGKAGGLAGGAGPLTAIIEALGFGFDVRNRMKSDDDGDGVGDQTAVQAVTGAGANTIASLTTFFTGLALFPEGISTGVGLVGLLGLSLFSGFVGDQAANVADSITGVTPPGQSGDSKGDGTNISMVEAGSSADAITPTSKSNNGENLAFSEDANIIDMRTGANAGGGNNDTGGLASPSGGQSDYLPSIKSSDNSNTFPALANSMYNLAEY